MSEQDSLLTGGHSGAPDSDGQNPETTADNWLESAPEDLRGWATDKGWKDPVQALESFRNLEEIVGAAEAGRTLKLPDDESDQEALAKIYDRLGRPEKADGYELEAALKDNLGGELSEGEQYDSRLLSTISAAMHEAGLSKKQGQAIALNFQKHYLETVETHRAKHEAATREARESLPPDVLEQARRGFRYLEMQSDDAVAVESYLGPKKAAEIFSKIGKLLGEDTRIEGTKAVGLADSPNAAARMIAEKKTDQHFMERYLGGDKDALAIMSDLHQRAYSAAK